MILSVSEKTYINSGSGSRIAGDFQINSGNFVLSGPLYVLKFFNNTANAAVSVVKKGDWDVKGYNVYLGNAANSTFVLTNATGNLNVTKLNGKNAANLYIANGASSTAEVVKEAGNWSVEQTSFIGNGKNSTAKFYNRGGFLTAGLYGVCMGGAGTTGSAYLEISGGAITNTAGNLSMGDGDGAGRSVVLVNGGEYCAKAGYVLVGARAPSTLTIESGRVVAPASGVRFCDTDKCVAGRDCFLNLNGGTLETKTVTYGSGAAAATFTFNGGTLKALQAGTLIDNSSAKIAVVATANGGTIDTAGLAVTIASDIGDASDETGKLTFAGNGTATLGGAANWTGMTTVEAGTVLAFPAAQKSALVAHGVTVAIPAAGVGDGTVVLEINDGSGTFAAADISAMRITGDTAGRYALALAASGAKVVIVDTQVAEYVWNGGSSDANWSDADKWLRDGAAATWANNNIAVFANDGDSATVDSDVTAASVTFRANATVAAGGGTLTVPSVSVVSDVSATINAPTAGALEKTGPGTLTLGASRTEATTLTGGTLEMSGSATLDWTKLTLGTDAAKPVTLVMGADLTPYWWYVGNVEGMNTTVRKTGGNWTTSGSMNIGCAASATTAFYNEGGTLVLTRYMEIGNNADATSSLLEISGGMVTNTTYYITIGGNSPGTMNVTTGGKYGVVNSNYGLRVGGSAAGTLNVAGGDVFVGGPLTLNGGGAAVNVTDGGVLTFNNVACNNSGTAAIALDGGTIRANADSTSDTPFIPAKDNMTLVVKSDGGTIDVNGKTITIAEPLLADATSTGGGMTFKGGGTVTLASGNTYTGTTTVEVGTTVHIPSASALQSSKIEVTVPATAPEVAVYTPVVIDGEGTLPSTILDGIVLPEGVTRVRLSGDGKSVICVYGSPVNTWIGGATGSLSDAGNWSLGVVPGAGESCVIGNNAPAMLTAGSAFAASAITFPADSAAVTISAAGEETLSGITAITNLSTTANHVFNVAVSGPASAAIVMNTQTYCVFDGGMTAYDVDFSQSPASDNARTFAGQWTLTTTDDWTPAKNATVASGASLTVKNYSNSAGDTLLINAGGVVTAEVAKVTGSENGWLTRGIYGTMVVTDECKMDSTKTNRFVADEDSTGTIIARKFSSTSTSLKYFLKNSNGFRYVVGEGGISGTGWKPYADWNTTIGCDGDFDITGTISGYTSGTKNTYTLDTTGGHRVALVSGGSLTGERMAVNVTGNGTLAFAGGTADFQKGLTVDGTATVAVNAGCTPGNGAVAVKAGATLEVAGSGTVTLGGDLTLQDGATLKFTFTERRNPPVLDLTDKNVKFGSEKSVNVSLSGVRPAAAGGGKYVLTSGAKFAGATVAKASGCPDWVKDVGVENGDIYMTVARGFVIILN